MKIAETKTAGMKEKINKEALEASKKKKAKALKNNQVITK
jgi:hypothetical protein